MITTPPFVFVLAAVLAWLSGAPPGSDSNGSESLSLSSRKRAVAMIDPSDMAAVLRQMESRILPRNPAPPRKALNAKGMEERLFNDDFGPVAPGSGLAAIGYSIDWAEEAPEEMFAWLVAQNGKRVSQASILFESWAGKDMKAALAAVLRIQDPRLRAQALISSVGILCKSDPGRALELLTANLSLFDEDTYYMMGSDPACIELIGSLPRGEKRDHLLAGLLNQMADSTDAVAFWNGLPESERHELVEAGFAPYLTHGESFDGLEELMRERAESTGDPELVEEFLDSHGETWARRDLVAALDWAQVHLKGKRRVEERENFFQTGIRENFDQTLRIWQTLPEGDLKARAAEAMVGAAPEARRAEAEAVFGSGR